jgi:hypothetical protein
VTPFALYSLLGAVVGVAALGTASSPSSSTAPAAPAVPALPSASGSSSAAVPQIQAAVAVALRTETDVSNLQAFGQALATLGYSSASGRLLAKAATLSKSSPGAGSSGSLGSVLTGPPDASGAPTPVPVQYVPPGSIALASGYVMANGASVGRIDGAGNFVPKGGGQALGAGGAPVGGSSEFGPSGLDPSNPEDLPYWVNLFAHAGLKTGQSPTAAQVSAAVHAALQAYEGKSGPSLSAFYTVLLAYGYTELAETVHDVAVLPFYVRAYTGSASWSPEEIQTASVNALSGQQILYAETDKGMVPAKGLEGYPLSQENLAYAALAFANALWASRAFGRDWKAQAETVAVGASQMFAEAGLPSAAQAVLSEAPGSWLT